MSRQIVHTRNTDSAENKSKSASQLHVVHKDINKKIKKPVNKQTKNTLVANPPSDSDTGENLNKSKIINREKDFIQHHTHADDEINYKKKEPFQKYTTRPGIIEAGDSKDDVDLKNENEKKNENSQADFQKINDATDDVLVHKDKTGAGEPEDKEDEQINEAGVKKQKDEKYLLKKKESLQKTPGSAIKKEKSLDTGIAGFDTTSDTTSILSSLQQTPASRLGKTFLEAKTSIAKNQEMQMQEAKEKMPEVPEKQGSIYGGNIKGLKKKHIPLRGTASVKTITGNDTGSILQPEEVIIPQGFQYNMNSLSMLPDEQKASEQEMAGAAQSQLGGVLLDTTDVPDSMGPVEQVDQTGDADSENINKEHTAQTLDVADKKGETAKEINNDFGENNIIPQPGSGKIKSKHKFKAPRPPKLKDIPPLAIGNGTKELDIALTPQVDKRIGEQRALYDAEDIKYKEQSDLEYSNAESKIEDESVKSKQKQFDTNNQGVDDVNNARGEWKKQLDETENNFQKEAKGASDKQKNKVKEEVDKGNKEIKKHHKDAASEAAQKKKDAEEEARKEKERKKKESSGFFGWLRKKAAALIDALKSAFNFIVKKLREAIKWVFDKFKKLITFVLNQVRKLIVGLIKAFGEILKGLVDIALAAFPEIRDKIKNKIDGAVNTAVNVVNKAFDVFIKVISAIIDFLAETIDKLYGILQSVISGILTVISMLVSGDLMELFRRMGNIVDAIKAVSFDTIKQGAVEELMGGNLDEPLSPQELMAAAQMGLLSVEDSNAGMPQAPWTPNNVGVDTVSTEELSPEVQQELFMMVAKGSQEMEIGKSEDPLRNMTAVMNEATGNTNGQPQPAEKKDDGLTPMQRAEIKWGMMKTGLTKWWNDNWLYVVGGVIGAIAAFIAAEVITGGAITAALPVILPILEYVFAGIAIAQFGGYVVEFLDKAWNGDIRGGTKALSRGLGAALIELAMYLGFGVLKVVGKAAKAIVKGVIKVGKQIGKAIIRGIKFLIEKGKVLFKGIAGKGLGKIAKSFRKLADDILEHTRFKKILLRVRGKMWQILAEINPLFVIMEGPLPDDLKTIVQLDKKGIRKGESIVDDQGRKLAKISDLDKFEKTPDYREIFSIGNKGKDVSGDVIHHLIEKNSRYANLFEKEIINAPKSLRAIPKGDINSVLHLSDIRKAWDDVYRTIDGLMARGLKPDAAKKMIVDFAAKTDSFIEKSLEAISKAQAQKGATQLTKAELAAITDRFKSLLK